MPSAVAGAAAAGPLSIWYVRCRRRPRTCAFIHRMRVVFQHVHGAETMHLPGFSGVARRHAPHCWCAATTHARCLLAANCNVSTSQLDSIELGRKHTMLASCSSRSVRTPLGARGSLAAATSWNVVSGCCCCWSACCCCLRRRSVLCCRLEA